MCLACELLRCAKDQPQDTMTGRLPPPAKSIFAAPRLGSSAQSFTASANPAASLVPYAAGFPAKTGFLPPLEAWCL